MTPTRRRGLTEVKRRDKIRLAEEATKQLKAEDPRDSAERDAARREWGQVRKAAREAFMAGRDWQVILAAYKERQGFYSEDERAQMCSAYSNELMMNALR